MNLLREAITFLKAVARKAAQWVGDLLRPVRATVGSVMSTHSRRMRTDLNYVTSVLGFIINIAYVVVANRLVRSRLELLARSLFSAPQRGHAELAY